MSRIEAVMGSNGTLLTNDQLGDSNTAYFQKAVKRRISRSRIEAIMDSNGTLLTNDQVTDGFVKHYEAFLGQTGHTGVFNMDGLFQNVLDNETALHMLRAISVNEDVVANNVTRVVQEFFQNGMLLKELNHTIIALIPKVNTPNRINDYCPISCCNVLFKCISKIISNRIKGSLNALISLKQSAFVLGRRISDNILLTQELMHNYHLDRGAPRCAFKVDIQKAYDTVDWGFLKLTLGDFGFHPCMVTWIMQCVTSTSFSICINGSLHGYFKGKRGLRQGDPMSPYLFTLIMELINLCFADDLFLFAHGDVYSAKVIMDSLDEFKLASGLTPSLSKSTAYFCNVFNHVKIAILHVLLFEERRLPVKYLGVPLVSSRLVYRDCRELLEKVRGRVNDWKNKSLSAAVAYEGIPLASRADEEREFIWCRIGDGLMASAWFDTWCHVRPLLKIVTTRDIFRAGFDLSTKVPELIVNGTWGWPQEWYSKYPLLCSITPPIIFSSCDKLEWHTSAGLVKTFTVFNDWDSIRPYYEVVPWHDVVWFSNCVPRGQLDSHSHLFFKCGFNTQVWNQMSLAGLSNVTRGYKDIVDYLTPYAKRRSCKSVIAKLVFSASVYRNGLQLNLVNGLLVVWYVTYGLLVVQALLEVNVEDNLEQQMSHESDDDMEYDPSNVEFTEWLASKNFNYNTMKELWIYWARGDDEVEIINEESSDSEDEDEVANFFRIKTNVFDFETPLCGAFKEFNYLLQIDLDVLTKYIEGFKTYEDYKDDWIYEWNKDVPWVWRDDGYCNGGNLPRAYIVGNAVRYQDFEWYEALKDGKLKEEALKNKAIMEGIIEDEDNESSNEGKERCELFDDHERPVCNIRRLEMIKYSFGQDEEYVVVKENEYDDSTSTSKDA
ncbi:protein LAZ1 [Tanacetum coccineum]